VWKSDRRQTSSFIAIAVWVKGKGVEGRGCEYEKQDFGKAGVLFFLWVETILIQECLID
jgi:hypothetical protein